MLSVPLMLAVSLRVAGIGDGLFIILLAAIVGAVICFCGFKSANAGLYFCAGLGLVMFFTLFMIVTPKEQPDNTLGPNETSDEAVQRTSMFGFLLVGFLLSLVMYLVHFLAAEVKATRLYPDKVKAVQATPTEEYTNWLGIVE
jgi:Na+/H+ antiporter NhaC